MRNTEAVLITREYINKHKTPRGAWTRAQIEALGIEWPAKQGWISRLDGEVITSDQARRFEEGNKIRAKRPKSDCDEAFKFMMKHIDQLGIEKLIKLKTTAVYHIHRISKL
jgi:hypothetical protein